MTMLNVQVRGLFFYHSQQDDEMRNSYGTVGKYEWYLFLVLVRYNDFLEFERARAEDSQRIVDGIALLVLRHD